jgi:hypothetical protein
VPVNFQCSDCSFVGEKANKSPGRWQTSECGVMKNRAVDGLLLHSGKSADCRKLPFIFR